MLRALPPLAPALALAALATPAIGQGTAPPKQAEALPPVVTMGYGKDVNQRGELRIPSGTGPFPVAVVIHGGCWNSQGGDFHDTSRLAAALTARGIATWNIEYRRLGNPGGGFPGTFQDVAAATDYLTTLAGLPGVSLDLNRVAVVGHDAGAHLALWLASRRKLWNPIAGAMTVNPATVVAIDGVGTLIPWVNWDKQFCGKSVIAPFMGGTPFDHWDAYALASPQNHLPFGVHQLIVEGSWEMMESYAQAALASADSVVKLAPGGADHNNLIQPDSPQGKQVVDFIAAEAFGK